MELKGSEVLLTCVSCKGRFPQIPAFWLLPYCNPCAARHYKLDASPESFAQWNIIATTIRSHLIAESTRKRYESEIKKASWPLSDPVQTMTYLLSAASSPSAMKQAVAAARRVHSSRSWVPPPFDHPTVMDLRQALKKRPTETQLHPKQDNVFTNREIKLLFATITSGHDTIHDRDAAILALQLFGVRRASEVLKLTMEDVQWDHDARQFQIRIKSSKTDPRALGLWYRLPRNTALEVNPTKLVLKYMGSTKLADRSNQSFFFRQYQQYTKRYGAHPLSVAAWNDRLAIYQGAANIPRRTSHAIRATAISLTPLDDVHTISQIGGWKSMTYLTMYHRTPTHDKAAALARIGKRILLADKQARENDSEEED